VWAAATAWALAGAVFGPLLALAASAAGAHLNPALVATACAALALLAGGALELELW
jgi:hypothetical protein